MALNFPNDPVLGDEWTDSNGTVWRCTDATPGDVQWTRVGNLPDGSVTTDKIADGAVTAAKLADSYEPELGLPASNGQVLSSDTSGNRSWVDQSGGSIPGYQDVGAYGFFANKYSGSIQPGSTIAGNDLKFAGVGPDGSIDESAAASPPGTWRAQGYAVVDGVTLFVRIS